VCALPAKVFGEGNLMHRTLPGLEQAPGSARILSALVRHLHAVASVCDRLGLEERTDEIRALWLRLRPDLEGRLSSPAMRAEAAAALGLDSGDDRVLNLPVAEPRGF